MSARQPVIIADWMSVSFVRMSIETSWREAGAPPRGDRRARRRDRPGASAAPLLDHLRVAHELRLEHDARRCRELHVHEDLGLLVRRDRDPRGRGALQDPERRRPRPRALLLLDL